MTKKIKNKRLKPFDEWRDLRYNKNNYAHIFILPAHTNG